MNTPSITPAQIVAFLQPLVTCAIAFGLPISDAQTTALMGLSFPLSISLIVADMFIRRARANNASAIARAQYRASQVEPTPPPAYIEGE